MGPTLIGSFVSRLLVASQQTLRGQTEGYWGVQAGEGELGVAENWELSLVCSPLYSLLLAQCLEHSNGSGNVC